MLGTSKRNPEKAFAYFRKAASLWQSPVAQYFIGMMYYEGDEGIVQNFDEAFQWLELAASNGWSDAMGHLANAHNTGEYVEKDLIKAKYWFKQIARKDNNENECIKNDIVCLFGHPVFEVDMNSVEDNTKKMVQEASIRRLASLPIHASIQISLRDTDSELDMVHQAFWWDTLANTKSNSVAASQFILAKIYELVILNKEISTCYYKKAAKNGNPNARSKIGL